ncbi:MAG: N-acetyl-gamma-glutamyl-phosphate reductase [Halioglobus sp.]|nr:N-acetyl-gamma-glutamyl-phosphate reductase [Halioglobus sp.]
MTHRIPAVVLGASGYVGGELLRLLAAHPNFELHRAVSTSQAGQPIGATFPSLTPAWPETTFCTPQDCLATLADLDELALFSAAPHGASAALLAPFMDMAKKHGVRLHVVDSSADFRYRNAKDYEAVYATPHGATEVLGEFEQGVPEHVRATDRAHVGHPGCFATAALIAAVPLCVSGYKPGSLFINGITGSTGAGRSPLPGTHHPERHSNLYAYKPLVHRHTAEIAAFIDKAGGSAVNVNFVPHSGPFARGIHLTLQAELEDAVSADALRASYRDFYAGSSFVRVLEGTPRIKDVVTSNYCHVGVAAHGNSVVIMSAIDNLVKGAAGGAVQWMNRLWSLPETSGLLASAPAWT